MLKISACIPQWKKQYFHSITIVFRSKTRPPTPSIPLMVLSLTILPMLHGSSLKQAPSWSSEWVIFAMILLHIFCICFFALLWRDCVCAPSLRSVAACPPFGGSLADMLGSVSCGVGKRNRATVTRHPTACSVVIVLLCLQLSQEGKPQPPICLSCKRCPRLDGGGIIIRGKVRNRAPLPYCSSFPLSFAKS